jgi:hypothetical protein
MPDIHLLANRSALARIRIAETTVASAPDGDDAVADTRVRLDRITRVLDVDLQVISAIDIRGTLRPPVPPPQTLQDLVRSGRRRLERERQGVARDWHAQRLAAVTGVRKGLDG